MLKVVKTLNRWRTRGRNQFLPGVQFSLSLLKYFSRPLFTLCFSFLLLTHSALAILVLTIQIHSFSGPMSILSPGGSSRRYSLGSFQLSIPKSPLKGSLPQFPQTKQPFPPTCSFSSQPASLLPQYLLLMSLPAFVKDTY